MVAIHVFQESKSFFHQREHPVPDADVAGCLSCKILSGAQKQIPCKAKHVLHQYRVLPVVLHRYRAN